MEALFLDVHTHRPWQIESVNVRQIENLHQKTPQLLPGQTISVGLHPWFLDTLNWEHDWIRIWDSAKKHKVVAIGETGLDRNIPISWELQIKVFRQQIAIANQYSLPLIIHCVRAFPEALRELAKAKFPIIFHGFSGKYTRIETAVKQNHYISFGKAILNQKSAARQSLAKIPLSQLLLETDGQDISIESIYQAAAEIKQLPLLVIKERVMYNASLAFPEWIMKS